MNLTPLQLENKCKDMSWGNFWKRKVLKRTENDKRWSAMRECVCECWKQWIVSWNQLRSWKSKSCWCERIESISKTWLSRIGWKKTRIYNIYLQMQQRCNNPKKDYYSSYWWRWIKCLRKSFDEFISDMHNEYNKHVALHWEKQTTIDRIDNDWNYCKENCRRATYKVQGSNRRNSKV